MATDLVHFPNQEPPNRALGFQFPSPRQKLSVKPLCGSLLLDLTLRLPLRSLVSDLDSNYDGEG